jgi:hypothetical protein
MEKTPNGTKRRMVQHFEWKKGRLVEKLLNGKNVEKHLEKSAHVHDHIRVPVRVRVHLPMSTSMSLSVSVSMDTDTDRDMNKDVDMGRFLQLNFRGFAIQDLIVT